MATSANQIRDLVIASLAAEEKRLLKLTVAVRKGLEAGQPLRGAPMRGDLAQSVKLCLRKLVTAGQITERDGVYSLTSAMRLHARATAAASASA